MKYIFEFNVILRHESILGISCYFLPMLRNMFVPFDFVRMFCQFTRHPTQAKEFFLRNNQGIDGSFWNSINGVTRQAEKWECAVDLDVFDDASEVRVVKGILTALLGRCLLRSDVVVPRSIWPPDRRTKIKMHQNHHIRSCFTLNKMNAGKIYLKNEYCRCFYIALHNWGTVTIDSWLCQKCFAYFFVNMVTPMGWNIHRLINYVSHNNRSHA